MDRSDGHPAYHLGGSLLFLRQLAGGVADRREDELISGLVAVEDAREVEPISVCQRCGCQFVRDDAVRLCAWCMVV